ncbi:heterokaryon incompatibility protein-domain-containing protein [Nemania sp. FL0916]|nr:heterokaryon incompatibility protein-domain-containing protein [Nemania sp. FL0916]
MNALHGIARRVKEEIRVRQEDGDSTFHHTRLSTAPGTCYFRLLELEENNASEIIQCRLRHSDLDGMILPRFEAVSYSWRKDTLGKHDNLAEWFPDKFPLYTKQDAASDTRLIMCNGKSMRIQHNLYDFLIRLRTKKRQLPLWIDAICIDQDETDGEVRAEKLRQLQMMGRIYASAETVLVWLGETDNIAMGFDRSMRDVEHLQYDYEPYDSEYDVWKIHKKTHIYRILPRLNGPTIESLTRLMNRNYFQRSWVVQELVLARRLVFYLGAIELPPDKLINGIRVIETCGLFPYAEPVSPSDMAGLGFRSIPHMIQAQQDRKSGNRWPFKDYLFICRDRQASRDEDKVLSILGLAGPERTTRLLIGAMTRDEKILLDRLYTNCAKSLAEEHGWPYVLTLIETGTADVTDLPSWVPDLRVPLRPKPFWYYGCTHHHTAIAVEGEFSVSFTPDPMWNQPFCPVLKLRAAYIDEIVQVGESHGELLVTQVKYAKGHILDLVTKLGKYYAGTTELSIDAVMRSLTGDVFERDRKIPIDKLRRAFLGWFGTTIRNLRFEPSRTKPEDSFFRSTARGRHAIALHNTSALNNNYKIDIETAVAQFVETHDSAEYPWRARLSDPPPNILAGEELVGVDVVESLRQCNGNPTRPLVNEYPSSSPDHVWRFQEQQIGSLAWAMNEIYQSRRIFRTRIRNLVGVGPRDLRLGDAVYLVAGTQTPFILRRAAASRGQGQGMELGEQHRMVGSAYLHGAMYGEFVDHVETPFGPTYLV